MKKIILLSLIIMPFFSTAQKIQNIKTKEVIELKEKALNYCSIVLQPKGLQVGFFIGIDEPGFFTFVDENNKQLEFQTIIAIMNFMHKNGWEYINNIGGSDGAAPQYFFKKRLQ